MATLKVLYDGPGLIVPFAIFSQGELGDHDRRIAKYFDAEGDMLVLEGKGFRYEDGLLVSGTIFSMAAIGENDKKHSVIDDMKFDAADFPNMHDGISTAIPDMLGGNDVLRGGSGVDRLQGYNGRDVINGRGGDDWIYSDTGNDTITGGAGADNFYILQGYGDDTITDFQSEGDQATHDQIYADANTYTLIKDGKNLIVEFDTGMSVSLLDFKEADLDMGDIILT